MYVNVNKDGNGNTCLCFEFNQALEERYADDIKNLIVNTMLKCSVGSENVKQFRDFFSTLILKVWVGDLVLPFFSRAMVDYLKSKNIGSLRALRTAETQMQQCFITECWRYNNLFTSILGEYEEWGNTINRYEAMPADDKTTNTHLSCESCWNTSEDVKEYTIDGMTTILCKDCYDKKVMVCPICGKVHLLSNCAVLDGKVVCFSCLNKLKSRYKVSIYFCCSCKEYHTKQRYGKNRVNEHEWCCDASAKNMPKCSACGVLSSRSLNRSFCGTMLCNACWAKKEKYLIKSYHNDPIPEFYIYDEEKKKNKQVPPPNNGNGFFYGLELEVDSGGQRDDASEPTIKILNDEVYAMRDGSLENGFEIITHPHTEKALYNMPWKEAFDYLVKSGYRSHDINTCGLHLHCNRVIFGLSAEQQAENIAKLMYFFENYREDFIKLSRREVQHINRWAKFYSDGIYKESINFFKDMYYNYNRSSRHDDRYRAINLCKKKTIEFRLMRGTLNLDTFFATLDILITISKNASHIPMNKLDSKKDWLEGIKEETKKYIKENKLFEDVELPRKPREKIIATKTVIVNDASSSEGRLYVYVDGRPQPVVVEDTMADPLVSFGHDDEGYIWDTVENNEEIEEEDE